MQVTCAGSTERSARVAARVSRRPAWCGGPRTTSTTSNASVVSSAPGSLTQVGQLYSCGFRLRLAGSGSDPQEIRVRSPRRKAEQIFLFIKKLQKI